MDINATSLLAAQLQSGRSQVATAVLKQSLDQEKQIANILAQAVEPTGSVGGQRGTQLDISV